jgi:hypothetical protein
VRFASVAAGSVKILRESPNNSLDAIFLTGYSGFVVEVLFTDEFGTWWDGLTAEEQGSVNATVILLSTKGIALGYPHSSKISASRHSHVRELRIQHEGRPYRVLYAFDPNRDALLLIGGDKTGNDRWYEIFVPIADRLYDEHLDELKRKKIT